MTHSVNAPLPPPAPTTGIDTPTTQSTSTGDVARNEAANVGQTAQQAGGQVASTAADQAREVAAETQRQARDLLDQGRSQLRDQAATQQQKAAGGLGSLAQELRNLADGTSEGAPGPARDLIRQASGKVDEFASWLQHREPADLLDEVRRFARRRPGAFLLGAATAGVLAGRLTSGVKAAHSDSGTGRTTPSTTRTNYVDPTPAYAGYTGTPGEVAGAGYTGATTGYPTGTTTAGYSGTVPAEPTTTGTAPGTGSPLPPPPYGTTPPAGSVVPPTTPAGWDDDPARRPGEER
ncbi:hypothetical protein OF117_19815 [Geodermatophilus sp. YIM 151500]|uniref:hypothetical protein n=1 Tax=Geodermatophilus sp. YIM 151500 TaxID=2984531 RepID=UPI0021E47034|nr:hypothetical protein [Geodermatophilus sp. YIM 151500]MCV2491597.1 hypothetical protein [Geodermatophilus sp. YIM 151500]